MCVAKMDVADVAMALDQHPGPLLHPAVMDHAG